MESVRTKILMICISNDVYGSLKAGCQCEVLHSYQRMNSVLGTGIFTDKTYCLVTLSLSVDDIVPM